MAALAAKVRQLPGFPIFPGVEPGGARYEHMGALLADAALQAAIDFDSVVKPRVEKLLANWPDAVTLDLFRARVAAEGLGEVLDWKHPEKLARALRLADLLAAEGVQTVADLRSWCLLPDSRAKLLRIKGVGEKTADYVAVLAGGQAIAVDRRIRAFVGPGSDEEIRALLTAVADELDLDLGVLDRVVWAAGKDELPMDDRPDIVEVILAVPADKAARLRDLTKLWLEGRPNAEWRATDHDLAIALWVQLDERRRRVFSVLIDHPGRRFRAEEIIELTGDTMSLKNLTSLLGHPAVLSEQLGRAWPWQYDYPAGRSEHAVYWFEPDIAALFDKARGITPSSDGMRTP
ncbi:DUF6416 domain-containing protein [Pseudonocardia terrae]|uniref:DUF6416 domain-containing protein n=1 Tax=Pseudonocardia terrae TaxID=2905831 RepID=UPI001E390D51|nr:DUF6416 domain-containing protein [Pseudonocardia terrae]